MIKRILTCVALLVSLGVPALATAGVRVLFDLSSPGGGPFPSDLFTVADATQKTGLRVNLPKPDCADAPSECADIDVINTLDGFNNQPRLSIPFSGPIDVSTVTSASVFLLSLGDTQPGGASGGRVIGINQIVWDPLTSTLHVESDEFLDQHTRYALIVTDGVRDAAGRPVHAAAFGRFHRDASPGQLKAGALKAYGRALRDALVGAAAAGVPVRRIVAASVFTTQSTTAVLEKIRDQIKAATPAPADFMLGAGGMVETVFPLSTVTGLVLHQQISTVGPLSPSPSPSFGAVKGFPGVGTLAFGRYASPRYVTSAKVIPAVGTRTGVPTPLAVDDVYFTLFVPAGTPPATGWPVTIFGHGFRNSKDNAPFAVASRMAANGIATITINAVGHGRGPLGMLQVQLSGGGSVMLPAGGRGSDDNGDTIIESTEGSGGLGTRNVVATRDGLRQTVIDLMQMTRVIETGGVPDLDPSRIYYFGQSMGGVYGTVFLAVEPSVRLGVPNVGGGPVVDITRRHPVFRDPFGAGLAARTPSLVNGPAPFGFIESIPLRDEAPVTAPAPGAMPIQELIERIEWVSQSSNPVAYAPHLRKAPLAGMPAKSVIVQFAKGDQLVTNPTTTAMLRSGDLADRATYYRHDVAFAQNPALPKDPHSFMSNLLGPNAGIALAAQQQIATFFASEVVAGMTPLVIDPDTLGLFPVAVFEVPIVSPLPETLNVIP